MSHSALLVQEVKVKRKPQTFSVLKNGEYTRYYDPRTPDNRNRPKSDFAGLREYTEMPSIAEMATYAIFVASIILVLVIGGSL
ncbi:MAG: hypothetical protein EBT27_09455 [Betaproteobacteria bacterium]|nr:hypothetical protein [Betaproteobacteria bacterium]